MADLAVFGLLPLVFVCPGVWRDATPVPTDQLAAYCTPWRSAPNASPYNPSLSDVVSQFAPWAKTVRVAWKEGSLPWRNRWSGSGTPLAANGQSAAFSPLTFWMFLAPLARAFTLLGASKLLLAAVGMHLWLSELGLSRDAARFGAVVFAFSFALTPSLYHPLSAGLALWPWMLFAVDYRGGRFGDRSWWLMVAAFAVWSMCGHLETVALAAVFLLLWIGLRMLAQDFELRSAVRVASAGLLAAGLASFLLIPQARAIVASNRLALARDPNHFSYVPWTPYRPGWTGAIGTSLFPRAYGDAIASPMNAGAAGSIVEMGFGYIGLVGWALALTGTVRVNRSRQDVLSVLLLVGLGGAMGLPLFRAFFEILPGIGLAPPLRLLTFVSLSAAALSAFGLEPVFSDRSALPRVSRALLLRLASLAAVAVLLFVVRRAVYLSNGGLAAHRRVLVENLAILLAAGAVCLAATGRTISPAIFAVLLTGVAALQLLYEGMRLYRFSPAASFYPDTPLVTFLRGQPGVFRVVGEDTALFPNTSVFAGLEDIRTHDPIERRDYVLFLDRTCGYPPTDYTKKIRDLNAPVLDFLNVRYLVADPGRRTPGEKWKRVYNGTDGTVFENTQVMPRFFAPPRVEVLEDSRASGGWVVNLLDTFGGPIEPWLSRGQFHEEALVLASRPELLPGGTWRQENRQVAVRLISETTNGIELDVSVRGGPTILVGSIVDDGGWTARDQNGNPIVKCRADGPFLALVVADGRSRVSMRYRPPGIGTGAAISGMSLLAALILLARRRPGRASADA